MFKFLHTADLHLGKIFYDQSLGEDQAFMLEQLAGILEDDFYSALVIAGDVYDRSIPSPEAVELFGSFLGKVKNKKPSLEVIVIPGNHDSASRIGFGRELFSRLGIHFGVNAADCDKPVIFERDGTRCAFYLLPFLNPGALEEKNFTTEYTEEEENIKTPCSSVVPLRTQSALAEEAVRRICKAMVRQGVDYAVLAAHLFTLGGTETESERVFLGNAEKVSSSLFENFDYTALGHLHRCQNPGGEIWYPGSPLAYSFSESRQDKYFLSITLTKNGAAVEKIPVKPLHKVTSLEGPFARFSGDISVDTELLSAKDDYLELRLTDTAVTENARETLRGKFPRLLSLRQDEAFAGLSSAFTDNAPPAGDRRDTSADFNAFLSALYEQPEQEELDLFNELLAEVNEEDQ